MTKAMGEWFVRVKVLLISAILVSIANCISSYKAGAIVTPLEALPGLAGMLVIVLIGCLVQELLAKYAHIKLPTILYISVIAMLASIPGFSPIAGWVIAEFDKISLLSLCTPILAYAGIAIGKDMPAFKKQGPAIICVALCTFFGTYVGSAIVAQIVLKLTHVI